MNERLVDVERALSQAEADALTERLGDELAKQYGVSDVELLLVDYRLSALLPLGGGEPVTRPGHPAWRSFDHQSEVLEGDVLFLPVTMRGDRLGVLRLAPVRGDDDEMRGELAHIADSLGHEIAAVRGSTDRYLVAARSRRLTLAAEMQWELLPGRSRHRSSFALGGQLEPAYAVRGDSFDWADDGHRLWMSAVNGSGEGIAAATLTSLATFALRNARRAGLALADQVALADQAVYARYRGEEHLAALLLEVDLDSGVVTAVDAGSPRLLLLRGDEVSDVELEAQLPMGMFDGTIYRPQTFELEVGDRLFVVSDGVYDSESETGGRYGETALTRFVRRSRHQAPLDAVRGLLGDVRAHVSTDLVDDAVAVCLDWTGPKTQ
ncbi:PP2C family protein-serine/threonine phosphatase [Asanoa sp. WMMD1127]|uniref:PP2C family protein-serine/threonine phosphatase n=1 Tax=Asanoa sp. WMMD1127 TaxID=3016107 RepID=UPI0024173E77|nr:PP2C family protein-serine/threonine phosphatase [Asanoa sp. WMMD1127]MDG4820412.1 PP2C family protein-serine/threonine phosphatase [Asanoa sp. WMMD1127]